MSHVHTRKNLLLSPAEDWIVIAKQHCVCALKEFRNERLEKGLDPPQWMQIVKVHLLKTETSWATRVAIAGRKQAIHLHISVVLPSEAADNFLMHLRDLPARPDESARDQIHRTIPKAASRSAWIPPHLLDNELLVCCCLECEASQSAIWQRTLLLCSAMPVRPMDPSSRGCNMRRTQRCSACSILRIWTHQ